MSISTCTGQRVPRARARAQGRLQLAGVVDDRRETERERLLGLRRHAAEHENGDRDARVPQPGRFGEARHREPPAAGGDQGSGDGNRTVAVGVGLHHRDHLARARQLARDREVRADRPQVDGGPGLLVLVHVADRLQRRERVTRAARAGAAFDRPSALG